MGNDLCCTSEPRKYVVDFKQCFDLKCASFVISAELKRISRISKEITFKNSLSDNYDLSLFKKHENEEMRKFFYYHRLQVVLLRVKGYIEEATIPSNFSNRGSLRLYNQSRFSTKSLPSVLDHYNGNIDIIKHPVRRMSKRMSTLKSNLEVAIPEEPGELISSPRKTGEEYHMLKEELEGFSSMKRGPNFTRRNNKRTVTLKPERSTIDEEPFELINTSIIEHIDTDIIHRKESNNFNNLSRMSSQRHSSKELFKYKVEIDLKDCISLLTEIMDTEEHFSEEKLIHLEESISKRLFKVK
jgi:hypothetical protein